ncbi:hypothetical protein RNJ44_01856 [Nakaseomyces bracarensis]|uniref:Cullin family profile domain-containing protein n=1 Tax=Nakaseomyces bracarensis TaxID=273131 RepID=A0ABR4NNY5_9SACH
MAAVGTISYVNNRKRPDHEFWSQLAVILQNTATSEVSPRIQARNVLKKAQVLIRNGLVTKEELASEFKIVFGNYLNELLTKISSTCDDATVFFKEYESILIHLVPLIEYLEPWESVAVNILPFTFMQQSGSGEKLFIQLAEMLFLQTFNKAKTYEEDAYNLDYLKLILENVEMSNYDRTRILDFGITLFNKNFRDDTPFWSHLEDYSHIIECAHNLSQTIENKYITEGAKILLKDYTKCFDIPENKYPLEALQYLYDNCDDKRVYVQRYLETIGVVPIKDCDEFFAYHLRKYECLDPDINEEDYNITLDIRAFLHEVIESTFEYNMIHYYRKLKNFCDLEIRAHINTPMKMSQEEEKSNKQWLVGALKKLFQLIPNRVHFVENYLFLEAIRVIAYDNRHLVGDFTVDFAQLNLMFEILENNTPHITDFVTLLKESIKRSSDNNIENGNSSHIPLYLPEFAKQMLQMDKGKSKIPCWPTKEYAEFWKEKCERMRASRKVLELSVSFQVFIITSDIKLKSGKYLDLICNMYTASIIYLYNDSKELSIEEIFGELRKVNPNLDEETVKSSVQILVKHNLLKLTFNKFHINEEFKPPTRSQKSGYIRVI